MSEYPECRGCKGTGQRLAKLTREQDYNFALQHLPIPKVTCWVCEGSGVEKPSEVIVREQRASWPDRG